MSEGKDNKNEVVITSVVLSVLSIIMAKIMEAVRTGTPIEKIDPSVATINHSSNDNSTLVLYHKIPVVKNKEEKAGEEKAGEERKKRSDRIIPKPISLSKGSLRKNSVRKSTPRNKDVNLNPSVISITSASVESIEQIKPINVIVSKTISDIGVNIESHNNDHNKDKTEIDVQSIDDSVVPAKLSFVQRLSQFKQVGYNALKDFLEVSELNLRVADNSFETNDQIVNNNSNPIHIIYDGVKMIWDSDGSSEYHLILSPGYISKTIPAKHQVIPVLKSKGENKMGECTAEEWIRLESEMRKGRKRWTKKITISIDNIDEVKTPETPYYHVPFDTFNCRLVSGNGRISRNFAYNKSNYVVRNQHKGNDSSRGDSLLDNRLSGYQKRQINAWICKTFNSYCYSYVEGEQYSHWLYIEEDPELNDSSVSKIHDYKLVMYVDEGRGIVERLPKFKTSLKYKLPVIKEGDELRPYLCYVVGTRSMGTQIEQYVGWINEDTINF